MRVIFCGSLRTAVAKLHTVTLSPYTTFIKHNTHTAFLHALAQGEVVEGSDSEIRLAVFVLALRREWSQEKGALIWKCMEVAMHGSQLYL
jgi:hypothetical protein